MERDLAETPAKSAMSSQDLSLPQQNTEEGEVAALRLTARSQVSVSLY